jgi:hypothetical protein
MKFLVITHGLIGSQSGIRRFINLRLTQKKKSAPSSYINISIRHMNLVAGKALTN